MSERSFQAIKVGEEAFAFEVMLYGDETVTRQPLLIFHSIEFPMPPSDSFCRYMWDAGLQVVFVRRPGYGQSSRMPDVLMEKEPIKSGITAIAEAAMWRTLVEKLDLDNIVLMAVGSSNPICFRLVHMLKNLERVIFVNPIFNQNIMQVFQPAWFREMLKQVISSKGGIRVADAGIKLLIKNDAIGFYRAILRKSPGDMAYIDACEDDYLEAGLLALETDAAMLYFDAIMCLTSDELLKDDYFNGLKASILIGSETTDHWQAEMEGEATRLGLPLHRTTSGDIFCAYAAPHEVLDVIQGVTPPARVYAE